MGGKAIPSPERKLCDRLGYIFADMTLLHQALTHGSLSRRAKD